jgi:hypothetical protein
VTEYPDRQYLNKNVDSDIDHYQGLGMFLSCLLLSQNALPQEKAQVLGAY